MGAGYHVAESLDLNAEQVTFRKPGLVYNVQREGDIVLWNADLIKALRHSHGYESSSIFPGIRRAPADYQRMGNRRL